MNHMYLVKLILARFSVEAEALRLPEFEQFYGLDYNSLTAVSGNQLRISKPDSLLHFSKIYGYSPLYFLEDETLPC